MTYKCDYCQKRASTLVYFKKYYRDTGLFAYHCPALMCAECAKMFGHTDRGDKTPAIISFENLIIAPTGAIEYLTNDTDKEGNAMNTPEWKEKIANIRENTKHE